MTDRGSTRGLARELLTARRVVQASRRYLGTNTRDTEFTAAHDAYDALEKSK